MVAVALLAINLMEQIGGAVDDEVLIGEVRLGIDTTEQLDNLQSVDSSVCVVDVPNRRRPRGWILKCGGQSFRMGLRYTDKALELPSA